MRRSYEDVGTNSGLIGAYFGICFDIMYCGSTPQNIYQNVKKHKYTKALARFLVVISSYILIEYLPQRLFKYTFKDSNTYVYSSLLTSQVPNLLFWFLTFGVSKRIFDKLNLINLS